MPLPQKAILAIEGAEIFIFGQDIRPQGGIPRPTRNTGEIVFPLSVKKHGKGTITKEYNPKKFRYFRHSMLDEGSEVKGPNLWGFASDPISRGMINVGGSGRTSSHSGQDLTITGTCFMIAIKTQNGQTLPEHPMKLLLE